LQSGLVLYLSGLPITGTSYYFYTLSTPTDDPVYMELHSKYVSQLLFDYETRASSKLFRVAAIQFVRSYTASRHSCWEATCEPVFRDASTGIFHVPAEVKVPGSEVTLTHALQGYCIAEYQQGTDKDPTYLPWVDQYIRYFTTSILPKYSIEDLPSSSKDLPSSTKDLPSSNDLPSSKDLPSSRPKSRTSKSCR
jgi:hypothetical protein